MSVTSSPLTADQSNGSSLQVTPTDTTGGTTDLEFAVVLEPLVVDANQSIIRLYRECPPKVRDALFEGRGKFHGLVVMQKSENFDLDSYTRDGYQAYTSTAKTYDPESKRFYNEKRTFYVVFYDFLPIQSRERIAGEFMSALWAKCFGLTTDGCPSALEDTDVISLESDEGGLLNGKVQQRLTAISTLLNIMFVIRDLELSSFIAYIDLDVRMTECDPQLKSPTQKLSVKQLIDQFNTWSGPCRL